MNLILFTQTIVEFAIVLQLGFQAIPRRMKTILGRLFREAPPSGTNFVLGRRLNLGDEQRGDAAPPEESKRDGGKFP